LAGAEPTLFAGDARDGLPDAFRTARTGAVETGAVVTVCSPGNNDIGAVMQLSEVRDLFETG